MQQQEKKLKIALFSKGKPSLELGATKNRIELAKALINLGWEVKILGSEDLGLNEFEIDQKNYSEALKVYLLRNAKNYDVVLYDHDVLPYSRSLFDGLTLLISRPALLTEHFRSIKPPVSIKHRLKNIAHSVLNIGMLSTSRDGSDFRTLKEADLVQVQNSKDKQLLEKHGICGSKIEIIPNGISAERLSAFNIIYQSKRNIIHPTLNFIYIGTFDYRKGMFDLIWIIEKLSKKYPHARFGLFGTKGMIQTKEAVMSYFSKSVRPKLDIVPSFNAEELPKLLVGYHIGIFTSYLESFGYAVLEAMAAGIPTVTYDIPGPCDFVPDDLQVPIGNKRKLFEKIIDLYEDRNKLEDYIYLVNEIANKYTMDSIGKDVDKLYKVRFQNLIGSKSSL